MTKILIFFIQNTNNLRVVYFIEYFWVLENQLFAPTLKGVIDFLRTL
jgi:hypothetical protein